MGGWASQHAVGSSAGRANQHAVGSTAGGPACMPCDALHRAYAAFAAAALFAAARSGMALHTCPARVLLLLQCATDAPNALLCRVGWATRQAELNAPVGADQHGYSYRSQGGSKVSSAAAARA